MTPRGGKRKSRYRDGWEDAIWFVSTKMGAHQPAREIIPLMLVEMVRLTHKPKSVIKARGR